VTIPFNWIDKPNIVEIENYDEKKINNTRKRIIELIKNNPSITIK